MRKGQTVKKQIKFREEAKRAGILVHGCFMVGFPGETLETMHKTLDLAIMLDDAASDLAESLFSEGDADQKADQGARRKHRQ